MTICLIDGDVLCYLACESRDKKRAEITDDERVLYELTPAAEYTDEENEAYLNKAFLRLQTLIKEVCDANFTEDYQMAVAGKGNFREDIYPLYKMNRHADPTKKNPFVPILRKMAVENELATPADGMEADDLLRIWAEEYRSVDAPFTICSIDKDLKMIEGQHWLIHHKVHFESTPEFARRFYYEQLLMGDATDNIQGVPKVGPVKAKELLKDCVTEFDFQTRVKQIYFSMVHQWKYALQLTGQLIYLKKHPKDTFDYLQWPSCELIDSYQPREGKRKLENWTMDSALAAINPEGITGRQRWEDAMAFVMSETEDIVGAFEALTVLLDRDLVPQVEKDAYATVKRLIQAPKKAALETVNSEIKPTLKVPQTPSTDTVNNEVKPPLKVPQTPLTNTVITQGPDMSTWKRSNLS